MLRLIRILLAVVVGVALIVFAIVNREPVEVSFAPFPASIDAPLFAVALVFLFLGVIAGGIAAWANASGARRQNRELRRRSEALDAQARELRRQLAEAEGRRVAAESAGEPAVAGGARTPVPYREEERRAGGTPVAGRPLLGGVGGRA